MTSTFSAPSPPRYGGKIETIRHTAYEARAALAGLLAAAGVDATKARESARTLQVNRGLLWRISRVVAAQDDVTVVSNLPGQVGLERLLEACRAKGVESSIVEKAGSAVRAFHGLVQSHAVDRRTLEILLANAGRQTTSLSLENARRAMFEGGCAVWGVRAAVRLRCMFLTPNREDPNLIDETGVAGYVGFQRLRQVPWPMSHRAVYGGQTAQTPPIVEPIDASGAADAGLPLLREFCVPRDLSIRTSQTSRLIRHELDVSPSGDPDEVTCIFGMICRGIYDTRNTFTEGQGATVVLDTPVERVIFDAFAHRSLGLGEAPETILADRLTHPHGFRIDEARNEALPMEQTARRLGPGAAGALTPHIPWYPRLIERVCERLGFAPDQFVGHRLEMAYPPIPTALVVQFPPIAPADQRRA